MVGFKKGGVGSKGYRLQAVPTWREERNKLMPASEVAQQARAGSSGTATSTGSLKTARTSLGSSHGQRRQQSHSTSPATRSAQVYAGFDIRPDLIHGVVVAPRLHSNGSERPSATARAEPRAMGRGIAWRLARVQMTLAAEARAAAALLKEHRADIVHSLEVELEVRG